MKKVIFGALTLLMACIGISMRAEIKLPAIITDHMVLKQKSEAPLWGTETPGTKITVETGWNKKKYTTQADADGNWMVRVKTPAAGGPYTLRFKGTNTVKVEDVLIGEVWIASGQSNMAWRMRQDSQKETMLPKAANDRIRLFTPGRLRAEEEGRTFKERTKWVVCTPETASSFSAMAYYFARDLQRELGVPVGVINASWGGVGVEAWTPRSALRGDTLRTNVLTRWDAWSRAYEQDSIQFTARMEQYEKTKKDKPNLPQSMYMMRRQHKKPSVLYNGMVSPCTPYALSGLIWYQGTSNVSWPEEYESLLGALIRSWRETFDNPRMPVIIGQLTAHNYGSRAEKAPILREGQLNLRKMDNVYVFCTMDAGDLKDIHPPHKEPYGQRFAAMAANKVYGRKEIPCICPLATGVRAEGNALVVGFDHAKSLRLEGDALHDVEIAGGDGKFVPARAEIRGNQLVVSASGVEAPKRVRYLHGPLATANLYNENNLPAFPFSLEIK